MVAGALRAADQPSATRSALFLGGLSEFARRKWNVTPLKLRLTDGAAELPAVEVVYFLDALGQIWKPPTIPYLPVRFEATATRYRGRLDRQWLTVGGLLANDMARRGVAMAIPLPPEIDDVRPWQWAGFRADIRYGLRVEFPHDPLLTHASLRRNVNKARRAGFQCTRVRSLGEAYDCIQETEERQRFSFAVNAADLELAPTLIGEDTLRMYVCYAPNGEPAAAAVTLHVPGHVAINWIFGTGAAYVPTGATQLLHQCSMLDLAANGACGYDFGGANIAALAEAKTKWGGRLVPFYTVDAGRLRALARHGRDFWMHYRGQHR